MLTAYGLREGRLVPLDAPPDCADLARDDVLWVDLLNPTAEEERAVEGLLGLAVPTRKEMAAIAESARLYKEAGALVVTAVVIQGVAEGRPDRTQVTFVLNPSHLVTVRYVDLVPFRTFEQTRARDPDAYTSLARVFTGLLESIVEQIADVLAVVAADLHEVSTRLFAKLDVAPQRRREDELQVLVRRIGRKNMVVAILRESLLSLSRLTPFMRQGANEWLADGSPARLKQIDRDLRSLTAYEAQLSSEIGYLHQATLGLINLDQSRIIKVFSIAAVLFLPPTLVGTIYGMNFEVIPELEWAYGYPFALTLMILSAVVPYWWFRRRGWL